MELLRKTGDGGVTKKEIDVLWPGQEQRERALQSLLNDGLVARDEGKYHLPH